MLFDDDWHSQDSLGHSYLSTWYLAIHQGILAFSTQYQNIMAQNLAAALRGKYLTQCVVKKDFKKY